MRSTRRFLHRFGLDIIRYPAGTSWGTALHDVLRATSPDVLIDVGAHRGAFSDHCRTLGYRGRIVSFEPAPAAFAALARRASRDPSWTVYELALGAAPGKAMLNLAGTGELNSLLPASDRGRRYIGNLRATEATPVRVARLDEILDDVAPGAQSAFLKSDTQGYDFQVLQGAGWVLDRISAIHVELMFQDLYTGATDYLEVLTWLRGKGFDLVDLVPRLRAGGLMAEADALLCRQGPDGAGS